MDSTIDVALDIIEGMYAVDDVFWMIFDYGMDNTVLEKQGILIDGRIAIERDEIDKARKERISTAWY